MDLILLVLIAVIAGLSFLAILMYFGLIPWIRVSKRDKEYLFLILAGSGAVLFWRGIWNIADITPVVQNPFVSLFIGLVILSVTGYLWREF